MEKQIREVIFSNGTATKTVAGFYQWSRGQILRIKGLTLPAAVEVHFALRRSGEAIRRIGVTKDGVTEVEIPDTLFRTMITSDYDAYAYIYVSDEEFGTTTHEIVMKIKSRPMPEDEKDTFENILKSVNAIADGKVNIEQGEENNGKYLGIVDGKVVLVDAPEGTSGTSSAVQYVEQILTEAQKTQARSNIGAASKAEVSELSDTVNDKLGFSNLSEAVNDALTQAKESGEFNGEDGYTPQKGTDYFTEADKKAFVTDVINALPTWQGGVY